MMRRAFLILCLSPFLTWGTPSTAAEKSGNTTAAELEILTFNIRYPNREDGENFWSHRIEFVASVMRERMPDIIGVQEAMRSQLDDVRKHLPEYGEIGVGRDDGRQAGEYSAILFRKDRLEPKETGTYWLSATPEVPGSRTWKNVCPRVCTWARFRHAASGRTFYLFNTHWDNASAEARTNGSKLMAERIRARSAAQDPIIVTGDFNCAESSAPLSALKTSLNVRDSFRDVHPDAKDAGTIHFWTGTKTRAKIDYILVDAAAKVTEADIIHTSRDGRFPSDHFPVRAKLHLK